MKILFILKSLTAPSARIRCLNFFPYFEEAGFEPIAEVLPKKLIPRIRFFSSLNKYDIVILQKKLLNSLELAILRKKSKILIFDFDDAIYHKDAACSLNLEDYINKKREKRFRHIITVADYVIAANNVLSEKAKEVLQSNARHVGPSVAVTKNKIFIINSPVVASNIKVKNSYDLLSPINIGWVGSKINLRYLYHIKDVFYELNKHADFVLTVISNKKPDLTGIKINFIEWDEKTEYDEIRKFDIGIMPLSNEPYSKGKAAYKLLQYMSVGVPSVCSNIGMNSEISIDGKYCLGADSNQEFSEQIIKLIKSKKQRKYIGVNAVALIDNKFNYDKIAERFIGMINRVSKTVK